MPKDEYISAGGGLKLKGAKSSGVDKKRKKTKKPKADIETPTNEATSAAGEDGQDSALTTQQDNSALERQLAAEERQMTKTESERKHEEMRRKRVCNDFGAFVNEANLHHSLMNARNVKESRRIRSVLKSSINISRR